jgi:hypothetical protein
VELTIAPQAERIGMKGIGSRGREPRELAALELLLIKRICGTRNYGRPPNIDCLANGHSISAKKHSAYWSNAKECSTRRISDLREATPRA